MSKRFRCCFASSIALFWGWAGARLACAEIQDPQSELTVGIHNYAGVPHDTLTHGQEQATEIFGRMGIKLRWVDCPPSNEETEKFRACGQVMNSGGVFLKILPERMAARFRLPDTKLGVAVPPRAAFVFYQHIENLAKGSGLLESSILGLVMTHELGHLLLGKGSHSADGIMNEVLLQEAFRGAEKGVLPLFTAQQAQHMRARLLERTKALGSKAHSMGVIVRAGTRAHAGSDLQLRVKVYNTVHVSTGDLCEAENYAGRILHQARINIIWEHVPITDEVRDRTRIEIWNPADLHLRLWPRASIGTRAYSEDTLGFRVSDEKSTAIIIADEIRSRAAAAFLTPGNLLGLVMAHEIGHLLLRSGVHSEGIMQARLGTDLRNRRRTLLVFTRQQAASMQDEVRGRRDGKLPIQ